MREQKNDNNGVLFPNGKKKQENAPDFTGNIMVKGEKYRLAGWLKESMNGTQYISMSVQVYNKKASSEDIEGFMQPAPIVEAGEDLPDGI